GNAMLGGLLQFLPAAAGAPVPARLGPFLLPTLNLGCLALLLHFLRGGAAYAGLAALLLGAGLGAAGLLMSRSARAARPPRLGRGLHACLCALLATLLLGLWMLGSRVGWLDAPRLLLVDLHAAAGLSVWVIGLVLCVASLAQPMLQGSPHWSPPALPL